MFSAHTRKQGQLPLVFILAGNILALISSATDAHNLVVKTVGFSFLPYVFAIIAIIILAGYVAFSVLFIRKILIEKKKSFPIAWLLVGLPLTFLIATLNFSLLPAEIDIRDIIDKQQKTWSNQLAVYEVAKGGGVPPTVSASSQVSQVWTTAQALTALVAADNDWNFDRDLLRRHFEYIERSRLPDPEGGWGYFQNFDWGVTEIAGWVLVSQARAVKSQKVWIPAEVPIIVNRIERDSRYLVDRQYDGGGWAPVGNGHHGATRTYSAVMALWALLEVGELQGLTPSLKADVHNSTAKGLRWLLNTFDRTYGWAPNPNRKPDEFSQGLSTQAFFVLNKARERFPFISREPAFGYARSLLLEKGESLHRDIYVDDRMNDGDQHIRGTNKLIEGSTYLWFPWSLASYASIANDPELDSRERERARDLVFNLMLRAHDFEKISASDGLFKIAENIFCMNASQPDVEKVVASEEATLSRAVSRLAKSLPLNAGERRSPYLPYLATTASILLLILAIRVFLWRLKAPKLAAHSMNKLPEVTVLLPVRNEARNVGQCLGSLLQQTAVPRIRVIDDSSEDSTVEIVERLMGQGGTISLVRSHHLPDGWKGKVHALALGLQGAQTPWILMTDADTRHHPELLARAQITVEEGQLDSISIAGFQEAIGLGENMLIPPVFTLLDGLLGDWRDAAKGEADVANGQFILVRREALESIGGLASIRNEALDDVSLVERLRKKNFRHSFFRAQDLLQIRMYRGLSEAFHGWRRIFGSFLAKQHLLLAYILFVLLFPSILIIASLLAKDWLAALVVWLSGFFASGITRASSKNSPFYAVLYPFDSILLAACLSASWLDARTGRLASWKGRPVLLEE